MCHYVTHETGQATHFQKSFIVLLICLKIPRSCEFANEPAATHRCLADFDSCATCGEVRLSNFFQELDTYVLRDQQVLI